MKKIKNILKFAVLTAIIGFLHSFAGTRNKQRRIKDLQVEFVEEQAPYINALAVDKLLIQNQVGVTNVGKEILALNTAEIALDNHRLIEESDVYLTVNGELIAQVKQRTPIARVNATTPYYVDVTGNTMPLSESHSARVPLVNNVSKSEIKTLFPLLKKIRDDEFLKKHITGVTRDTNGAYHLGLRVFDFEIHFGKVERIEGKFKNFKAFYQKALKDESLGKYKEVSLQFRNQVVCTLK